MLFFRVKPIETAWLETTYFGKIGLKLSLNNDA